MNQAARQSTIIEINRVAAAVLLALQWLYAVGDITGRALGQHSRAWPMRGPVEAGLVQTTTSSQQASRRAAAGPVPERLQSPQ